MVKKGVIAVKVGEVECIHTKAEIWLRRRRRFLRGSEKLALMGVPAHVYNNAEVTDEELGEMAGNAFHADCIFAVLTGMMTHCHWLWGC